MEHSPPSSKKQPLVTMDIDVTLKSNAMRELRDVVLKEAQRGRYILVIVHPDDAPEGVSLATLVTERRGEQDPYVLREDVTVRGLRDASERVNSIRSVVILRGETVRDMACEELFGLIATKPRRPLVVVAFASQDGARDTMALWPPKLRALFYRQPIEWPRLAARRADFDGIIDRLCGQCVSRDGRIVAEMTDEAKETLIRDVLRNPEARVAMLRSRIRRAFDAMLRCGEGVITPGHLNGRTQSGRVRAASASQPSPPT
ncbi:hypothetical protein L0Y59_02385 [Candidatus Uhrbacteria bacterium]|nr:hypothetical protein [Candidatus Uhrbacteria bacterium]